MDASIPKMFLVVWGDEESEYIQQTDRGRNFVTHKCVQIKSCAICSPNVSSIFDKSKHIHLKIDNKTAVAYIKHLEGTHSVTMDDTATEIIIMAMGNSKEYSFDRSAYSWNTKCPSTFFEQALFRMAVEST